MLLSKEVDRGGRAEGGGEQRRWGWRGRVTPSSPYPPRAGGSMRAAGRVACGGGGGGGRGGCGGGDTHEYLARPISVAAEEACQDLCFVRI